MSFLISVQNVLIIIAECELKNIVIEGNTTEFTNSISIL